MALAASRSWIRLATCAGICLVVTVLEFLWIFFGTDYDGSGRACRDTSNSDQFAAVYLNGILRLLLLGGVSFWLTACASTPHIRQAAAWMVWNWAHSLVSLLENLSFCALPFYTPGPVTDWVLPAILAMSHLLAAMVLVKNCLLVQCRLESVQASALQSLDINLSRKIQNRFFPPTVLLNFAFDYMGNGHFPVVFFAAKLTFFLMFVYFLVTLYVLYRGLFKGLRLVKGACKSAPGWLSGTAAKVHKDMLGEVFCLTLTLTTTLLVVVPCSLHTMGVAGMYLPCNVLLVLDTVCNCLFVLELTGCLSGAVRGTIRRDRLAKMRKASRQKAMARYLDQPRNDPEMQLWEEKVQELAGRGISVSVLLQFYGSLREHMPHFDPSRHSTRDVVRQAIIPLSAERRSAATKVLMGEDMARPDKMVTHAWSNLFRDLLAAVLADVFEEGEYALFAQLLDSDLPRLQDWVQRKGMGGRRYWICAFSVNQHMGICAADSTDPVTDEIVPGCKCDLPKVWNDTAPVLPDGRSVECEMNKFDDMMRLLAMGNADFGQVLAVDQEFATFERAWCIAEVAASSELGMSQDIKIGSPPELAAHSESLRKLRIQDMKVSRQEDKVAILASIPDHEAFNKAMQRLLFEDLLPSWASMDALERMASAGNLIRWQASGLWSEGKDGGTEGKEEPGDTRTTSITV